MMTTSKKWIVLVGIDFYVDPKTRLRGAVNDVEDMHLYFTHHHDSLSIKRFTAISSGDKVQNVPAGPEESWPTHKNITEELKRINNLASPGDFVHFHYSGHGTLVAKSRTTLSYEEKDGTDSALVLFDKENGVRYLHGIELASLFDAMIQKKLRLTVILDCCHSGGVSRSDNPFGFCIRGIPWDPEIAALSPTLSNLQVVNRPLATFRGRDVSNNQHWLLKPHGYTLLAACGPSEIARECKGAATKWNGAFSFFLLKALTFATINKYMIKLESIHRQICAYFHTACPNQHPILHGSEAAILMSSEDSGETKPVCNVIGKPSDTEIILNVGQAHGVSLGDEYTIYPVDLVNKAALHGSKVESVFKITAVSGLDARAELIPDPENNCIVQKGWHAILSRPYRSKCLVKFSSKLNCEWRKDIAKSLWLEVAEDDEGVATAFSFYIDVSEDQKLTIHGGNYDTVPNLPAISYNDPRALQRIFVTLEHLAQFAYIEAVDHQWGSSLTDLNNKVLRKSLDDVYSDPSGDFSICLTSKTDPEKRLHNNIFEATENEQLVIIFKNNTGQSLYLTILNMQPLRGVSKLIPRDREYFEVVSKDYPFPAQRSSTGEKSFSIRMSIPENIKAAGQKSVEDVLKFFVTTQPRRFSLLQLESLPERLEKANHRSGHSLFQVIKDLYTFKPPSRAYRMDDKDREEKWTCRNYMIRTSTASQVTDD
jgi:Caspase domain